MADYLVVDVAGGLFAADLAIVVEVMATTPATTLPGVPEFVLGITNIAGEATAVVDLAAVLHMTRPGGVPTPNSRQVVLAAGGVEVAVVVDAVVGVAGDVSLEPPLEGLAGDLRRWCTGLFRHGEQFVVALDASMIADLKERARPMKKS